MSLICLEFLLEMGHFLDCRTINLIWNERFGRVENMSFLASCLSRFFFQKNKGCQCTHCWIDMACDKKV